MDIVGYAYFEIADQEMELLHKALVDIFWVILHNLSDYQHDFFYILTQIGRQLGCFDHSIDLQSLNEPEVDDEIRDDVQTVFVVELLTQLMVKYFAADSDDGWHRVKHPKQVVKED